MGAQEDTQEREPLVQQAAPATGQPSHIAMAVSEGQLGDERSWNGHLLQCFGSCDHTGMSTAAYVHSCAPVAWGHNMKRAFGASFWKHALLFVLFFSAWGYLYIGASYNVGMQCGPHPPHPHPHPHDPAWGLQPVEDNEWMQPGNEPAGLIRDPEEQVFLTGATLQPMDSLFEVPVALEFAPSQVQAFDAAEEEDDEYKEIKFDVVDDAEDKAQDAAASAKVSIDVTKGQVEEALAQAQAQATNAVSSEALNAQIQQVKQKVAEGMAQLNAQLGVGRKLLHDEDDDEEGEKAAKKAEKKAKKAAKKAEKKAKKEKHDEWKEHRDHEEMHGPKHGPQHGPESRECRHAQGRLVGLWAWMCLSAVAGVFYAARTRTNLRKRFNIRGSRCKDCLAWLFCGPCALCQETRTLAVNNVHSGVWFGPTMLAAPLPSAVQAPKQQIASKAPTKPEEPQV